VPCVYAPVEEASEVYEVDPAWLLPDSAEPVWVCDAFVRQLHRSPGASTRPQ